MARRREIIIPDELMPELPELPEFRSRLCEPFLEAYRATGTLAQAARIVGCSSAAHHRWVRDYPEYAEIFKAYRQEADDALVDLLETRVKDGVSDQRFDKDGNLMFTNIRQDSSLMKMALAGRMPERYGNAPGGGNVNITVVRVNE